MSVECHYTKTDRQVVEHICAAEQERPQCVSRLALDFSKSVGNICSASIAAGTLHKEMVPATDSPMEYKSTPQYRTQLDLEYSHETLQRPNMPPLDSRDLELLTHYISHTSRIIPYDEADLYVLHIGIPNLAFSSKPLMSSMLALAAACQCHDLLPTTLDPQTVPLDQIGGLLALADRHHRSSLHHIQEVIGAGQYDIVLANAALMTLYGHAVHCVRIRLVDLHKQGSLGDGALQREFVPAQSQWISLIRAVHCAYIGLRADSDTENVKPCGSPPSLPVIDGWLGGRGGVDDGDVKCRQDGPAETTMQLFLPVVSATVNGAMHKLRRRVQRLDERISPDSTDFQTCMDALVVLESTLVEVFSDERNGTPSKATQILHPHDSQNVNNSLGRLSVVAPWLRTYAARVTSNCGNSGDDLAASSASRPLRRTINAFLNRVDSVFLTLVQATLERIPFPGNIEMDQAPRDNSAASRCAMDIFAHWLVLVCLLDAVWWIGDIGMWELGRVVTYMEGFVGDENGEVEDQWWPESMYKIRTELKKQGV